jgi:hypothetical protein
MVDFSGMSHDPDGLAGRGFQVQSIPPSSDHDYDGLTDAVETSGWWNAGGFFVTDPLDPDSDDDGLTDGKEKLYDTNPLDDHSPGIYVEYEDHLKTRQYFAKHPNSPQPWGWQQYGDRLISLDAVVVRRGATFSVGGPADATIQIEKSIGSLTTLTPVRDACTGRWRVAVPTGGTVGQYDIIMQEGDWSKGLNLYVIFELPTPTSSFTQAMINKFLYDDDPENMLDEASVLFGDDEYTHDDYPSRIPPGAWTNEGESYAFRNQQFEPFVFEEHVIGAINGRRNQWDTAEDLVAHADRVTRFNNPRVLYNSWDTLHPGSDDSNQCSNIAGLLVAFLRAAGIPARALYLDRVHESFDHATEVWLNGTWYAARGYRRLEPPCGWDCDYGYYSPRSRSNWGRNMYRPWHSGANGIGSVIAVPNEDWRYFGQCYRWPSWDWDVIARQSWFETVFVPYWSHFGWDLEPRVVGGPHAWPPVNDFTIAASPISRTVTQDSLTSFTVILDTSDGFSNLVDLSVTGLPANTTAYFDPGDSCVPDCNRTLAIDTTADTPIDTYELIVRGESGGLLREATVELVVTNFAIDASPDSQTVEQGSATDYYTVSLEAINGFDDVVDLSVTGLPADTTAQFTPPSCSPDPDCSSTLSIATTSSTPTGSYILTISGDSDTLHHETTVELVVTQAPDFTINASPGHRTVEQGDSANYTVSLGTVNGFDDTVDLSVTGLPANTTAYFADDSCVPNCNTTLAISTTADTPTGSHTLIIHGDSDPLHHQTSVDLTVDEASGQATSGSPLATASTFVSEMADNSQTELTVHGVNDYGIDLDGDGYFDQLVVEIEVNATQEGTYWIQGKLGADHHVPTPVGTGGLIAAGVVRADLTEGPNMVQLAFDGLRISAAKVDGPYVLKYLSITDVDNPTPEDFANSALGHWTSLYTTATYRAYDFQNWGAALSSKITEQGIDADGDMLYESLIVNVGLDIFAPGTYTVQGDLYDSRGRFIARATWTGTGPTATLQFDELSGTSGPYTLNEVSLFNTASEIIDSMVQTYTTQQVLRAEGRTHIVDRANSDQLEPQAILPDTYSDSGLDLDGDGLYDLLVINVQVEADEAGQYRLEGWLAKDGSLISWAGGDPVTLITGAHSLSLTFSGPAINAHNTDGPFTLMALKLLEGSEYEVIDEIDVAYTTSAYTHDQFESLPYLELAADEILLFEDFLEDDEGNWTADSPWALITAEFHSPTHSWTDSPDGNYANRSNASLTTGPIDPGESSEFSWPSLQFQTCYDLETDFDYGYVEISTDEGVTWTSVAAYTGRTVHWSGAKVSLGVIDDAQTLRVRFRLETDRRVAADGWYVDNVVIYLDNDLDDDGIPNDVEVGDDPDNPVDTDGDGTPDYQDDDSDDDGVPDSEEGSDDTDGDGVPDYQDDDSDNDGIADSDEYDTDEDDSNTDDLCTNLGVDQDGDNIPTCQDNDADDDGTPNYLDPDSDDDGIPDSTEAGDSDPDTPPVDTDSDGVPDYLDDDSDDDGCPDSRDPHPRIPDSFYYLPFIPMFWTGH